MESLPLSFRLSKKAFEHWTVQQDFSFRQPKEKCLLKKNNKYSKCDGNFVLPYIWRKMRVKLPKSILAVVCEHAHFSHKYEQRNKDSPSVVQWVWRAIKNELLAIYYKLLLIHFARLWNMCKSSHEVGAMILWMPLSDTDIRETSLLGFQCFRQN